MYNVLRVIVNKSIHPIHTSYRHTYISWRCRGGIYLCWTGFFGAIISVLQRCQRSASRFALTIHRPSFHRRVSKCYTHYESHCANELFHLLVIWFSTKERLIPLNGLYYDMWGLHPTHFVSLDPVIN